MSFLIDPFRFIKPPEGDEYTKLLLHFDGEDGATTTIDSSASAHVMAFSGATLATDQSKFGDSAYRATNATSYVQAGPSSDFDFGTGDFTIDCWVRFASTSGFMSVSDVGSTKGWFGIFPSSGGITISRDTTIIINAGGSPLTPFSTGVWYHLALVRSGNSWKVYRGGVLYASATNTVAFGNSTDNFRVGQTGSGDLGLNGWVDEFRVSKGIARWISDFTPPTAPYS